MKTKLCLLIAVVWTAGLQINSAAESDLSKLAAANNTFAFKLLKQLSTEQPGASIFVSPYSAATALQMVGNGAAGQTKTEMQQILETAGISTAALNEASKAAAALLDSKDTNLILTTANALWYRQGVTVKPGFIEANQKFFSSAVKALDFGNARAAEAQINQWASDQTHGRINGIADGMIDPIYTDLILANAIYFKGKWLDPFDAKLTKERPFHPAAGAAKNLPMMAMSKSFTYRKGSGYQAVRLPYMGYDLAMYVFLPDPGSSPAKLLQIMDGDKWRRVTMPGFSEHDGLVVLPKFKLENTLELNHPLEALGMKTAFNQKQADFSGMFNNLHFISEVRQKAFVEVNEEGTEAAAVTAIPMAGGMPEMNPPKPFEMIVDRPFLFAIVDARSEMILFMGVVNGL
jgi:serine protease inhibitor